MVQVELGCWEQTIAPSFIVQMHAIPLKDDILRLHKDIMPAEYFSPEFLAQCDMCMEEDMVLFKVTDIEHEITKDGHLIHVGLK